MRPLSTTPTMDSMKHRAGRTRLTPFARRSDLKRLDRVDAEPRRGRHRRVPPKEKANGTAFDLLIPLKLGKWAFLGALGISRYADRTALFLTVNASPRCVLFVGVTYT